MPRATLPIGSLHGGVFRPPVVRAGWICASGVPLVGLHAAWPASSRSGPSGEMGARGSVRPDHLRSLQRGTTRSDCAEWLLVVDFLPVRNLNYTLNRPAASRRKPPSDFEQRGMSVKLVSE